MANVSSTQKIVGLENALKELKKLEPDTVRQLRKDARLIAAPAVKAAKEEFKWQASVATHYTPDQPGGKRKNKPELNPLPGMSRGLLIKNRPATKWIPSKVLSGISFKLGGAKKKGRGKTFRMFTIGEWNAAGAIYDMAGKLGGWTNPEKRFEESLAMVDKNHSKGGGKGPSRFMYPAVISHMPHMEAEMLKLVKMVEQKTNRRILKGGK